MSSYTPNGSIIERANSRIQTYMSQVYGWMAVGLLLTAFVAWFASTSYEFLFLLSLVMWVLLIAEIGLVFVISEMINRLSGAAATILFSDKWFNFSIYFKYYTSFSIDSVFFLSLFEY